MKRFLGILCFCFLIFNSVYAKNVEHKATDIWYADETSHYKKCEVDECSEKFSAEEHSGGSHENGGMCSICRNYYQTHDMDNLNFSFNEENHLYKCSYIDCNHMFFTPHEKSVEIGYDGVSHWYKCTNVNCQKRFEEAVHDDGENNDGVCLICKRKYEGVLDSFGLKRIDKGFILVGDVGDSIKLQMEYSPANFADTSFEWRIGDNGVAEVSQEGIIKGVSKGVTNLYIKWRDKEISFVVCVAVDAIEIEPEKDTVTEGESTKILIVADNIGKNISWSVNNTKLAEISQDGVLTTFPGAGGKKIEVYANLGDKQVAKTTIKVNHGKTIAHKDGNEDKAGKCEICEKVIEEHTLKNSFNKYNDENHWKTCSNSKCKDKKFYIEKHIGEESCTLCKWKKKEPVSSKPTATGTGQSAVGGTNSGNWERRYDDKQHWEENTSTNVRRNTAIHSWDEENGICTVCGMNESEIEEKCDHENKGYSFWYNGNETHGVYCKNCYQKIRDEDCPGEDCECREAKKEEGGLSLNIPIKVYYIEEKGLKSIDGEYTDSVKMNVVSDGSPTYSWTVSSIPGKEFSSKKNTVSDDGTIRFWYDKGFFYAKLSDSKDALLSEEITVTITLSDKSKKSDSEKIKLIKSGPPRSYCQIYFNKETVSIKDNKLKLLIKTKYNDFSDEQVRELGEEEFPLYGVKDKIKIVSKNTDILTISGEPVISKVTDGSFNGYIAEVPIEAKSTGQVQLEVELTTEYTYSKSKSIEKERKYMPNISIMKTKEETNNPGNLQETPEVEKEDNGISIPLACGGAIALLIIAFVGSKMIG